jgi:voltage-gated potassium channel
MDRLKTKLYRIVFRSDTPAGRLFDLILLWLIVFSVLAVILESIPEVSVNYRDELFYIELFFTALFTLEYIIRIAVSPRPLKYMFSYLGIIDLLGIMPFYISLLIPDYRYLMVFRLLRMLRVFRILRLFRFLKESERLFTALRASMYKIIVFTAFILTIVVLLATVMYVVEGPENGFESIPQSIYWTIVTITTVGYGDITPQTAIGKWIASIIMLCGYVIIAVPTGLVTVAMTRGISSATRVCDRCNHDNPKDAHFCNFCGSTLKEEK